MADLEDRAIMQLERAAAPARSLGARTESAGHLLLALDRAKGPATRARVEAAVAWALADSGDYERTIPHAVAASEAYGGLGDPVSAGVVAAAHGTALWMSGDHAGVVAIVEPRWDALLDVPGADTAVLALGKPLTQADWATSGARFWTAASRSRRRSVTARSSRPA